MKTEKKVLDESAIAEIVGAVVKVLRGEKGFVVVTTESPTNPDLALTFGIRNATSDCDVFRSILDTMELDTWDAKRTIEHIEEKHYDEIYPD